jgi:hypothetical protein
MVSFRLPTKRRKSCIQTFLLENNPKRTCYRHLINGSLRLYCVYCGLNQEGSYSTVHDSDPLGSEIFCKSVVRIWINVF